MGFAGHMIDRPLRQTPRFPPIIEPGVRLAIQEKLNAYQPELAVSSAACGGDIIFIEEALKNNIPTFIILPFEDRDDFIGHSIAYAGSDWVDRFNNICSKVLRVFYVNPGGYNTDSDFEENQHAIVFFTLGFSRALNVQTIHLLLFDETQPVDGTGGTKSYLDLCVGLNLLFEKIDLAKIRKQYIKKGLL